MNASWRGKCHFLQRISLILNVNFRYTDCHNHSVITVFSAPNYCDVQMNLGAVVVLSGADILKPEYKLFKAVPHPEPDDFLIGQLLQSF